MMDGFGMGFGSVWMWLFWIVVILGVAALIKYLMSGKGD